MSGACLVDQTDHGIVKPGLTAKLTVRLHEQRAVGFVSIALQVFGNIAGLEIGASCILPKISGTLHSNHGIGKYSGD